MKIMIALRIAPAAADDEHGQLCVPTASPERQMRKHRAGRTKKPFCFARLLKKL